MPDPVNPADAVELAGGRALPNLLFLTSAAALTSNIGNAPATEMLATIGANAVLVDTLSPPVNGSTDMAQVTAALSAHPDVEGVVILGGYDVVAARRVDCLPASIRSSIDASGDPDQFIVWSDDPFGDINGDMLPELPVSRVPDGHSAAQFATALAARNESRPEPRKGVRNILRPFADSVYLELPGAVAMATSSPTVYNAVPHLALDSDLVYLMLHGDWHDATRFYGEDPPAYPVAVNISNIPTAGGRIVFAGCCWGALPVTEPAAMAAAGSVPPFRTPADSMALAFIQAGATAFVGATGVHYSPPPPPDDGCFGGPMHHAFWSHVITGSPPSKALFEAKGDYLAAFPHGQTDPSRIAIEYKMLREFTCLGLGW